jgi:hypothetical protein
MIKPALLLFVMFAAGRAPAQRCDLSGYSPIPGIVVSASTDDVTIEWTGEADQQLRARFALRNHRPVVSLLAARNAEGSWITLGEALEPQFEVTAGRRRISSTEMDNLKAQNETTPENIEQYKWNVFWDAPLVVPGGKRMVGPGRTADEITRAKSSFNTSRCVVKRDAYQVTVTFDGLSLGIFAGDLQFTIYKGSNLLRQEAIAKTTKPDVAYIYKAGLGGFTLRPDSKLVWRDTSQVWQEQAFGGEPNQDPVNLRARNRLEVLEAGQGSLAIFPPPHKFFFARENEVNLGYVYYRKDRNDAFSLGIMQPEHGEGYWPWGISDDVWKRRSNTSREQVENYALYNAPPNTLQHMAVYYYLSPDDSRKTQQAVMAYTHGDVFKPVPGFKTVTGHFHLELNEMARDRGTLDLSPTWVPVFRGLGINIVYLGDFHDDSDIRDPGAKRLSEQKLYFEAARRLSDRNFLVMPEEEVNDFLGGHWYMMSPKPFYFTHAAAHAAVQPFEEQDPIYGHVYHLGSASDVLKMVGQEQAIIWTAHPRTKSSALYPDTYKDKDFFQSDRFIGASWESLPVDLSQQRLCEVRCFGTNDDMSNWAPQPKFMLAEGDTYMKRPDDDTYPFLAVNYLKLDKVPDYNQSWQPIVEGIHHGDFFGTTGEILFHNWHIEGSGEHSSFHAELEYTFPLDFAELVWSDGATVNRKIIPLKDTLPFGERKELNIPFDANGKRWVRLAIWDTAGDGAWLQPVQPR